MRIREIVSCIDYVGVNDRTTQKFEALWPLPQGVSYNSYIVRGSKCTALIDAVEISQCEHLLKNMNCAQPDYLVINHMEPDHSGAIPVLRKYFPQMTIVGNIKTLDMVKNYYGIEDNVLKIADGEELDLGGLTLRFYLTPMIHWPETMMTYVPERKLLFTGDAFGCFGALNGAVTDSDIDISPYIPEMYRYYSNIVGKYGIFVQKAINKLSCIEANYLCPTHGPVWHENLRYISSIYNKLSKYEAEPGVVIVYGSMYGNTEDMAELIADQLVQEGVRNIRIHNASYTDLSYILSDIFKYNGLIIGAPTYSNGLYPPVEAVLNAIKVRDLKNRYVGAFGSFTWAPQSLKRIKTILQEMSLCTEDIPMAETKCGVSDTAKVQCISLAKEIAAKVLS
ncbi:FprA family A-type flavoprotein [uncultured Muribaculum sp.]|uniref:FprA family A-type flavoprotein n=2 Tax=uncultured Muribaculum sp. TaxID=1918613 RepID=UPI0025AF5B31|nr:FprA family A-type flavoprotein [uncultured Muribaculum sp.]